MNIEQLIKLGVDSSLAEKIVQVASAEIKDLNEQNASLKKQLDDQIEKIADYDNAIRSNGQLSKKVGELKEQRISDLSKFKAEMRTFKRDLLIHNALTTMADAKCLDVDIVRGLMDLNKIDIDESGNLIGFEDQIKCIKESKPFLFSSDGQKEDVRNSFEIKGETPSTGDDISEAAEIPTETAQPLSIGARIAKLSAGRAINLGRPTNEIKSI